MIGLGKMGANMTERLIRSGHEVVAFDVSAQAREAVGAKGAVVAGSLADLAAKLSAPRAAWVMVPAGEPTTSTIDALAECFEAGDVIVDGGNSNYKEAAPTAARLATKGIGFVDAGTSGGVWGLEEGYCLMVGGSEDAVRIVEPALRSLAPEGGYAHVGPVGAGHFVKMVHNGIEYGLMQAYAEGFEIMAAATEFNLDLHEIASIWRYGPARALRPSEVWLLIPGRVAGRSPRPLIERFPPQRSLPPCMRASPHDRRTPSAPVSWPPCGTSSEVTR